MKVQLLIDGSATELIQVLTSISSMEAAEIEAPTLQEGVKLPAVNGTKSGDKPATAAPKKAKAAKAEEPAQEVPQVDTAVAEAPEPTPEPAKEEAAPPARLDLTTVRELFAQKWQVETKRGDIRALLEKFGGTQLSKVFEALDEGQRKDFYESLQRL